MIFLLRMLLAGVGIAGLLFSSLLFRDKLTKDVYVLYGVGSLLLVLLFV